MSANLTVTDLFAGAGGSSTGMVQVPGVQVRMAANHWRLACEVHNANHPHTDHAAVDLHQEDPAYFPTTDLLWASPECFAAGTLVLTERGLVPIEGITVGERVFTHRGRYMPVTHVMTRRADTVRLIGQGLTRGLEVTAEHPILTTTGAGVLDWTRVADIALDGRTRWATPTEYPAAVIPPIDGARPVHVEDPRFAWLVGRWLGDGSLRVRDGKSSETFITCGKHEAADLEERLTWVHHDCGTCAPELTWSRRELRTAYVYANSHSEFARWLREHFGQHAHGKTVPAWALGAPSEWRRALLDGYLSADGHDNGRGWQAVSVSKPLALGVRLLAESIGHRVGLTYSHRDTWRIKGRTGRARPQWSVQWLHHINRATARTAIEFGGHSWGTVNAVEPAHFDTDVYDLTVDEDHSYVADGIVVHNCTKWSQANGTARPAIEEGLFEDPLSDDAATRSRLLMFDVLRFAEHHRYRAMIVENVIDIATQAKYRLAWHEWRRQLAGLGYRHRVVSLNSMHAQALGLPAPQSRDRIYIVAWRHGERAPDVERALRPRAYCPKCDAVIDANQSWKNGRTVGRYRQTYLYVHGACGTVVEPAWLPAAAAIDWSIPGERIGDRLKPKTRMRIAAGIARYWGPLHIEETGNQYDAADPKHPQHGDPNAYYRAWPAWEYLRTLTTQETRALAIPVEGRDGKTAWPLDVPLRTQTTRLETGLAAPPFIAELYGTSTARPVTQPAGTFTANGNHHGLVTTAGGSWNDDARPADEALRTLTSRDAYALVTAYYGNAREARPDTEPLGALTTIDRYALVHRNNTGGAEMTTPVFEELRTLTAAGHQALLQAGPHGGRPRVTPEDIQAAEAMLPDVLFRMFRPHEVAAGMAFPADYDWDAIDPRTGRPATNRDLVKMAGNAVTPPAARDLIACVVEAITGEAVT